MRVPIKIRFGVRGLGSRCVLKLGLMDPGLKY